MTDQPIYERLNGIFRRQFKDDSLALTPETTADDVRGWDSLAHIRLILSTEKEFGIKFRTSEVSAFKNVGDLAQMVKRKCAERGR